MRRTAAPSYKADAKRARFESPIIKKNSSYGKENKYSDFSSPVVFSGVVKETSFVSPETCTLVNEDSKTGEIRTNEDILDLILSDDLSANSCANFNPEKTDLILNGTDAKNVFKPSLQSVKPSIADSLSQNKAVEDENKMLSNCVFCVKNIEEGQLFNVLWCKRSSKKHKVWEADGFLIVRSRSAILKDLTGKVLDRGFGYKLKEVECIEESGQFFIGGKECEIQYKISQEEIKGGKYCKCDPKAMESSMKQEIKSFKSC